MKSENTKIQPTIEDDEMRPEYDLDYSKAERGKFFKLMRKQGAMFVLVEPEIAKFFKDAKSVNEALRRVIELRQLTERKKLPAKKRKIVKPTTKAVVPASV